MTKRSRINFDLNDEFIRIYCRKNNEGMLCPFLLAGECVNFTHEGVSLHREIRSTEVVFKQKGCDYVLIKILLNKKDFFIGRSVEYTDGSNLDDPKILHDLEYDRKKNKFSVLIKSKNDKFPFPISIQTDYLSFLQTRDSLIITDELGHGNSITVKLK